MDIDGLDELDFGTLSTVSVRGTGLEMFTAGSGAPILFLHGLDGLEGSAEVLRELSRHFTVYAPSHPGFGGSDRPSRLDRVDDLGYFYLDLLTLLTLDRPVIAGVSFGAWVAAEMLTKEPALASRLVLASPLGLPTAHRREQYVADIFMLPRQEVGARMQVGDPTPGSDMAVLTRLPEDRIRRLMRNDEAASLYGWTPYMANPKLGDRLHRVTAPTLILWGEDDAIVSMEYRTTWARAMPQASVETMPQAGHRLHADQPAGFAARVAQFAHADLSES
jgi:pimeloyl-ACP methyl ester carboxylesterase